MGSDGPALPESRVSSPRESGELPVELRSLFLPSRGVTSLNRVGKGAVE